MPIALSIREALKHSHILHFSRLPSLGWDVVFLVLVLIWLRYTSWTVKRKYPERILCGLPLLIDYIYIMDVSKCGSKIVDDKKITNWVGKCQNHRHCESVWEGNCFWYCWFFFKTLKDRAVLIVVKSSTHMNTKWILWINLNLLSMHDNFLFFVITLSP